ncbi:restriction endonuclease subunit S [Streptomyces sp. DHE7-1]|nr:restriction endonuclease subunit S [Streptomyces sp. DHE7-1]
MTHQAPADDEWRHVRLDSVGAIVTGSTPPTRDRSNYGRHRMFAGPGDLGRTKYVTETSKMLSACGFARARSVPAGSTLFVCIGSTIGKVGLAAAELATNQQINAIIPNDRVDPEYLYYAATTLAAPVRERAGEQAVPLVNKSDFSAFEIPLPSLEEQRRIAATLQEVDRLAVVLEALIVKKQAVMQGLMQQLLTGQTRLPGHTGEWSTGPLKDFLPLQRGFDLPNSRIVNGPYPVVYSNGIARHHAKAMVKGPGVVTGRSGTIGKVHFVEGDYWPHNTSLWVTSFARVDAKFAYYFLAHIGLERFASGSGVPTFNRNDAHSFEITVPSDRAEQTAIADVLSAADSELEALRRRRAQVSSIRIGMMQELLTGRTRLPVQGETTNE